MGWAIYWGLVALLVVAFLVSLAVSYRRALDRCEEHEMRQAVEAFKTGQDDIDRKVEEWHQGAGEDMYLHEYLGWTWEEYRGYVEQGIVPKGVDTRGTFH